MMLFSLSPSIVVAAGIYSCLLTIFYALVLIRAFGAEPRKALYPVYVLLFGLNAVLFKCFSDLCDCLFYKDRLTPRVAAFGELRVSAVAAVLVLLTVAGILLAVRLYGNINTELTPASLMEGLDMLPDGICYSTQEGVPLLVNRKMQSICLEAFGTVVLDTAELEQRFISGEVAQGCSVTGINDSSFLHLKDGSVWNIAANDLVVKKMNIREVIAYDVTEAYGKSRELENQTRHLAEVNKQLREYSNNLDEIIREREILSAKIRLHDDVGRSLLALRAYLTQQNISREQLVSLWKFTVAVLRREAVSSNYENRMETLAQAAQAVDVRLEFDGEIPELPVLNKLIAQAVHECLTNTVKHADGSVLTVKTREENGVYTVEMTNDGKQPDGVIIERGGLRNLRTTVEMNGGEMEIMSKPRFMLRLRLRG